MNDGVPLKGYVAFELFFRFCVRKKKKKNIVGKSTD